MLETEHVLVKRVAHACRSGRVAQEGAREGGGKNGGSGVISPG